MFLILGITGQTGGAAATRLLEAGEQVRALVRDPSRAGAWAARGVELVQGEAADGQVLERAMDGVTGAYVLVPPAPSHPDPIVWYEEVASAVRAAVERTKLPRLVLLSSEGAHLPSGTGPIRGLHLAEIILDGAAARTSFLRPSFFQENWRAVLGVAAEQGVMPSMLTDVDCKRPMVAAADIGRAAASLLRNAEAPAVVELAGPLDYSVADAAAAMAAALGRPVQPVALLRQAWTDILVQAGLGRAYADLLAEMYDGINSGHVAFSGLVPLSRGATELAVTVAGWELSEPA